MQTKIIYIRQKEFVNEIQRKKKPNKQTKIINEIKDLVTSVNISMAFRPDVFKTCHLF